MKRQTQRQFWRRQSGVFLLVALFLAGGTFFWWRWPNVSLTQGALREDVYVWQYQWNDAVRSAMVAVDDDTGLTELLVVAAEIMPGGGSPKLRPVWPDYAQLARSKKAVGLVIRIGAHGGPFEEENPMSIAVRRAAEETLRQAREAGLNVAELQLDFDCPTRCLADYAQWVRQVKAVAEEISVTVTALPSWLDAVEFRKLIKAADGYVLQVHSVTPPKSPEEMEPLCDSAKVRRWVRAAARLGKPFRVALPTYAYGVGFDVAGNYRGVAAEVLPERLRDAQVWRLLTADAGEMAGLLCEWRRERPTLLTGVVWYRLPVEGDRFNWSRAAWRDVREGKIPVAELRGEFVATRPLLRDASLANAGELPMLLPEEIVWEWDGAVVVALDAVGGYRVVVREGNRARLRREGGLEVLLPGEKWPVGWLRLAEEPEALRMTFAQYRQRGIVREREAEVREKSR